MYLLRTVPHHYFAHRGGQFSTTIQHIMKKMKSPAGVFLALTGGCVLHCSTSIEGGSFRHSMKQSITFSDFSTLSPHIVFRLLPKAGNEALLSGLVTMPFLDLCAVFYCYLPGEDGEEGRISTLLSCHQAARWGKTPAELFSLALENAPRLLPFVLHSMNAMLEALTPEEEEFLPPPQDPRFPMFVLTNKKNMFGAACLLYEGVLQCCAEQLRSDFYVLPSSVHEVLLIPALPDASCGQFTEMVREVNETQVAPEERLSDHAYFYSWEKQQLMF